MAALNIRSLRCWMQMSTLCLSDGKKEWQMGAIILQSPPHTARWSARMTQRCWHDTHVNSHTHTHWNVLKNISLFVGKDLMREKLAQGTDCLSHRVSVFKCPLLLLFMRQCSLYVADWQGYSPPLRTAAKDNALQSHIIYLTSSHYSSLQLNIM